MLRIAGFLLLLISATTVAGSTSSAQAAEIVRYKLADWKAKHIHDAKKADTISDTLKKLGCETARAEHNGHIDVRYRCPQWRQLDLKTHEEASKWEKWLKDYHFETEHRH